MFHMVLKHIYESGRLFLCTSSHFRWIVKFHTFFWYLTILWSNFTQWGDKLPVWQNDWRWWWWRWSWWLLWLLLLNRLSPSIHIQILQTDLHTFPVRISWENLVKHQGIFSFMIIFYILSTLSLDNVWTLLGETCCWSLLRLKGLTVIVVSQISSWLFSLHTDFSF